MKFCEHVSYDKQSKTYTTSATIMIDVKGSAKCGECGAKVDVTPLFQVGWDIKRDDSIADQ